MAVKILEIKKESCPACRLIGKRYEGYANWAEWWENNWFATLENIESIPFNGDAYIGAVHIADDMPERWIGMFFPVGTEVPEGFEYVDIESLNYAVFYLSDKENSGDFYTMETHNMCLAELEALGFQRKEDDWCFERYNCPRFTTPDEKGNVILDYGIAIK
ncbi:MAG: GyrI-like domain-containing protein [Lachnospiraceae bacterium]|nr:GyrI-like domain-containing protein [Lachnospiraceae bacterium]